ncbi:MAG: hypothetical protein QOF24_2298 [Verrucomicrobiota bacterium]|jgi:hypothetical protein
MASDKWTERVSACPCGKGRIVADIDSPDNPWSRPSRELRIECDDCEKQWVLSGESELVDRKTHEASSAVWHRLYEIEKELEPLASRALDEMFEKSPAPTFKAERQMLTEARLCFAGPIVYPRERKAGASVSELCEPLKNLPWIISRTTNPTLLAKLEPLAGEKANLEASRERLWKEMKRISLRSLPP